MPQEIRGIEISRSMKRHWQYLSGHIQCLEYRVSLRELRSKTTAVHEEPYPARLHRVGTLRKSRCYTDDTGLHRLAILERR